MAETLWKSQAHMPGKVLRQICGSPASLFKVHSLSFTMALSFYPSNPIPSGLRRLRTTGRS